MASPFKYFRKNQKMMLAVLGVLCMFGFVIVPVLMQGMSYQKVSNPRVATTTKFGDLTQSNLRSLLWQRQVTIGFLETLGRAAVEAKVDSSLIEWVLARITQGDIANATSDEALAENWLLAHRAEQLGLVVNDTTINAFLDDLTQKRLTPEVIHAVLKRVGISENQLFAVLGQELLALRMREMFSMSVDGLTPAEHWDYYQRLNRRVSIESFPVPVSDFVEKVPTPDESTLREFFEQHKGDLHDPRFPEPGFRQPKKVAVEYLKAEYENFLDLDSVTDEEIQAYYEENKDRLYREEELPTLEGEDSSEPDSQEASGKPQAPEPETAPGADADSKAEPQPEPPADQEGASEAKPADNESSEEPPAPAAESDDTSMAEPASPFRLVSLAQDLAATDPSEEEPNASGEQTEPREASDEGPALQPASPQEPAEEKSADPPPAQEPSAESPPAQEPPADAPSAEPEAKTSESPPAPPAEVRYLPLEKVEDEIRRELARQKTPEKIGKLFNEIAVTLDHYHNRLIRYEVDKESSQADKTPKLPQKPDFAKLAEEHGLTAGRTGLISALEAEQTEIGKTSVKQNTFVYTMFEREPKHKPVISQHPGGDFYLSWKVDEQDEMTPKWEQPETRAEVERQWKMLEARKLADEHAQKLAAQARKAQKPLREVVPDSDRVADSEPFSWYTYGSILPYMARGRPPRLGEVEGVDMAGNGFMEAVFRMKKGEVGSAVNQPKTIFYVVRVTDSNPLPEVLWRMFLSERYRGYLGAAANDLAKARDAWLDGIKAEVGFQWAPDFPREPARSR